MISCEPHTSARRLGAEGPLTPGSSSRALQVLPEGLGSFCTEAHGAGSACRRRHGRCAAAAAAADGLRTAALRGVLWPGRRLVCAGRAGGVHGWASQQRGAKSRILLPWLGGSSCRGWEVRSYGGGAARGLRHALLFSLGLRCQRCIRNRLCACTPGFSPYPKQKAHLVISNQPKLTHLAHRLTGRGAQAQRAEGTAALRAEARRGT